MNTTTITTTGLALASLYIAMPAHADNVLIIIGDDMGTDKVSSYAADYPGYAPAFLPDTQAIDSLAASGIRFTRAWATPLCSSTRASLQTGLSPSAHGIGWALGHDDEGLDTSAQPMLAQTFARRGYATGMFGKWHIGSETAGGHTGLPSDAAFTDTPHPVLAGWERFFGFYGGYPGRRRSFTDWPRIEWLAGAGTYVESESEHNTELTAEAARDWINLQVRPWLAVVAFSAPHSPDTDSDSWQYEDALDTEGEPIRTRSDLCLTAGECPPTDNEAMVVYQALTENVDLAIEGLLRGIDATILEDTLIIYMSDNGSPAAVQEASFDVGHGKGTTYESGIRVPLIVADGKTWLHRTAGAIRHPGRVVEAGVNTLDIHQTVHNHALRVSINDVESRSFTDCFDTTDVYCDRVGAQYGYTEMFRGSGADLVAAVAVRYGYDTMVASYCHASVCMEPHYFDTENDPLEDVELTFTGARATRLQNHFTSQHAAGNSWAYIDGSVVGFCAAPCP